MFPLTAGAVDARLLGWLRIAVGCDCLLRALSAWTSLHLLLAPGKVRIPYALGALPLTHELVPAYIGLWVFAAAAFTVGWHTRLAGAALAALMTAVLFVDQLAFSNHLYFLAIITALLCIADCGASGSLDAYHRRELYPTVAAWRATLLKTQLTAVYVFTALAKVNAVYLSGVVIWLNLHPTIRSALSSESPPVHLLIAGAVGSIVFELWLAFALWSKRLRRKAVLLGLGFHATLPWLLSPNEAVELVVFSILSVALYPLFFDHLPRHVTVYYDDSCGICVWLIGALKDRDTAGRATFNGVSRGGRSGVAGDASNGPIVTADDVTGERFYETAAITAVVRVLPFAYQPLRLLNMPGMSFASNLAYRVIARHRPIISKWFGLNTCVPRTHAADSG